jgi:hypothetical protein
LKTAGLICACVAAIGIGIIALQSHLDEKRQRAEVAGLQAELVRQREAVAREAMQLAHFRAANRIKDLNPMDLNSSVSRGREWMFTVEDQLRDEKLKIADFEAQFEKMNQEEPEVLREKRSTYPSHKALLSRQQAKAEDATLENSGVASFDPRRQALRAQIEASNTEIRQHNSVKLEIERRTLAKLKEELKLVPDPAKHPDVLEYKAAKARYLSDNSTLEAAEKEYARRTTKARYWSKLLAKVFRS